MRNKLSIWLLVPFLIWGSVCLAQKDVKIPTPKLQLQDNTIYIAYDILNSHSSESFIISIEVRDSDGNQIRSEALEGDVGKNVSGGSNKLILWNLEIDNVIMNAEIFVDIYAERMVSPLREGQEKMSTTDKIEKDLSRSSLILQSLAFPGLGLTKATGNPHWIKGLAAYGCLGGAVVLNRMAISTYQDFLNSENSGDADALFSEASSQDMLSESLVYVAIGIWVTDLIWTMVGTSNSRGGAGLEWRNVISINGGFDESARIPLVGFTYRF